MSPPTMPRLLGVTVIIGVSKCGCVVWMWLAARMSFVVGNLQHQVAADGHLQLAQQADQLRVHRRVRWMLTPKMRCVRKPATICFSFPLP